MASILSITSLAVSRPGHAFAARLPELELRAGEAVALLGPSGCGKTTILRALLGLQDDEVECRGRVSLCSKPLPKPGSHAWRETLRQDVAFVPADPRAALDPLQTLGSQLLAATGAAPGAIAEALIELGIESPESLLHRHPHQVSGGQAQRVLLALALLRAPALLIADEPAASLDGARRADVVRCLRGLQERTNTALLLATHDHDLVEELGARAWVYGDGRFLAGQPERPAWPEPGFEEPGEGALLALTEVGVRRGSRWILRDVDLELRPGEILALVGPSGAGKTTLALVLAGHLTPSCGHVTRRAGGTAVQMLFQDARGSLTPARPISRLLAETATERFDVAREAAALGFSQTHLQRSRGGLSSGEQRRAALLRALSVEPQALILDEPTASLDRASAVPVWEMLLKVRRERAMTFLLVTHDLSLAHAVAHRVLHIEEGRLCD